MTPFGWQNSANRLSGEAQSLGRYSDSNSRSPILPYTSVNFMVTASNAYRP